MCYLSLLARSCRKTLRDRGLLKRRTPLLVESEESVSFSYVLESTVCLGRDLCVISQDFNIASGRVLI